MQTKHLITGILAAVAAMPFGVSANTAPDTWVGSDELGRIVPSSDNRDGGRTTLDDTVEIGMFYYIWHGTEGSMKPVYDNTDILEASTTNPLWGPERHYHWWGRPWLGYYDAGDKAVIYKHLQMLCDAGVDFVVFDCTNGLTYVDRIEAFIDVIRTRQKKGMRTPRICFMTHSNQTAAIQSLWNSFYSKPEYSDILYRWQGNPLLLCDANAARADKALKDILPNLNLRHCWAWTGGKLDTWSWLDNYPQKVGYTVTNGKRVEECISVGTAQHPTTNIGKSFHGGKQPAVNAKGLCSETPQGLYFAEQWSRARSFSEAKRPKVVFLTQWNEFIAMRFRTGDQSGADPGKVRPGGKTGNSNESYFVDAYTAEYNRDIEPSTHPLIRDNYYMQMVEEIRKYRGVNTIPVPTQNISISISGSWEQWDKEPLEFTDDNGDNSYVKVAQDETDNIQGNDILSCKVTKDDSNIYFLVTTRADIKWSAKHTRNMRLLLNSDRDYTTGWEGYDFLAERDPATGNYQLKRVVGNGSKYLWATVSSSLSSRSEGKNLMLAIPKTQLQQSGNFDFDFKWIDNCNIECGEPMLMYSDGDCAPNHRFNYRFKGSRTTGEAIPGEENSSLTITEIDRDSDGFKAYPNPTSGLLNIESTEPVEKIDIYSIGGALTATFTRPGSSIDLSSLPAGHYILSVDSRSTHRIIKR